MDFHPEHPFDSNHGENVVWSALRTALGKQAGSALYRVPLIGADGFVRYEPDVILLSEDGLPLVLECKGCRIEHIASINGASWQMSEDWFRPYERPISQAREQAIALSQQLRARGVHDVPVFPLVVLPFVLRSEWMASAHAATGIDRAILFAEDLEPESLLARWKYHRLTYPLARPLAQAAANCLSSAKDSKPAVTPPRIRRVAGAPPIQQPPREQAPPGTSPEVVEPGLHFLRYQNTPPSAQQLRERIGLADGASYTYLVATGALERARRAEGLGGQHQVRKDLRRESSRPEQMELLFHKALRHFISRPVLTRAEESLVLQRAIREVVANGSTLAEQQLRRDVFAWRDVMAELEQQGLDLSQVTEEEEPKWIHPGLLAIAQKLQKAYRSARQDAGRGRTSFEDLAGHYLDNGFHPTPVVVMEGFTRLTALQERFIQRCLERDCRVWVVQPHASDQSAGFAAIERAWSQFAAAGAHVHEVPTPPLSAGPALRCLQASLFTPTATAQAFPGDDSVRLRAYTHRNDEICAAVAEVIDLLGAQAVRAGELAIVCADPVVMAPLLREEAELLGQPDLFAVPPRQLLLTPVGRFALTLYEIWRGGQLHLEPAQFTTLLAAGWLGGQTQRSFEQFEAVAAQQFTHCRTEEEWKRAFARIHSLRTEEGHLANLARRLPASRVDEALLHAWEAALDTVVRLCQRLLRPGERSLAEHIRQLLDEIEKLDEHRILEAERAVLVQIRDALGELTQAQSVTMGGEEFGQILGSLIHQREDPDSGELQGAELDRFPQRVWVVGPEGIDNVTRDWVFFLGVDDSRMPASGLPPWPRGIWSVDEHVERQRYRFLAVTRAARKGLRISFARQDWERELRPSPYLEQAADILAREEDLRHGGKPPGISHPAPTGQPLAPPLLQRDAYSLEELAIFQLCPHRFKLEALSDWGQCYGNAWQLEWLARGIWLAEAFRRITASGGASPINAGQLREAMYSAQAAVQERFAGLPPLSWLTIERDVGRSMDYLAKPWDSDGHLLAVLPAAGAQSAKEVKPSGERTVRIHTDISYRQDRGGQRPVALPDVDLAATWLMAGRNEDGDRRSDPQLRQCVKWWRDMVFRVDSPTSIDSARYNELLQCVLSIEQARFPKASGDHCRYCPVESTCMGVNP